jgi:hypothetical protein
MIRIKLLDGETVETIRHTYEQACAARDAGVGIEVGGPDDNPAWIPGDDPALLPPVRMLYPAGIASIERAAQE